MTTTTRCVSYLYCLLNIRNCNMPLFRPDAALISILLLCVPLQYLIVKYWGHSESGRTHAIQEFLNNLVKFQSEYLEWESWKKWCSALYSVERESGMSPAEMYPIDEDNPLGESPAVEVMRFKQKEGFFALSPEPRSNRTPRIKYRIGQVVTHKFWKYRGVIIGWDDGAKAPNEWLENMHGKDNLEWRSMPNYAVLVDVRDRLTPQITYVPEVTLEPVRNIKIMHPLLDDHFEKFDGVQYIPRPWLKAMYPVD